MDTRKYESPLGGDKTSNNRWIGPKGQAALALAISLWIAGGGVVWAENSGGTKVDNTYRGTNWLENNVVVYDTNIDDIYHVEGTRGVADNLTATNNKVTIGGNVDLHTGHVAGAWLHGYGVHADGNTVIINSGTINDVYGGYALGGGDGTSTASGNTVIINGGTIKDSVVGGYFDYGGTAEGNIVELNGATILGSVYGGFKAYSAGTLTCLGNELILSGANTVGNVKNFQTVNITSAKWGTPVLTLTGTGIMQNIDGTWATIDTRGITFTGVDALNAGQNTILIKNKMTNYAGTILSGKYKVGTTLEGTGKASIADGDSDGDNDDLIYTIDTDSVGTAKLEAQEQTHNTVMGAAASMAALSAGNDFVGAATEGLSMAGNTGTDGMATYANMGGGSMNVETGSHVKTHTWNAILALGHKNEKKLSTTEYGAFFEYGTGNYTTFNGAERGDGSTHYTGGGILGKWQKNNGFYVEGSLRAGSIHDDATNVLRDVNGNPYSYDTDATYWGAHIGVGREIKLNKTDILDLYAKYFYNHRGSVSFDAGGHYDLDAVESSVLRIGTRYTVKKNDKVNFYGGLALEHEFCGRAAGTADGVAIRGADISGTSVRGEIGATFQPGDNSPVTLDLNLSGFAGKKRGLTGGLSAIFHF